MKKRTIIASMLALGIFGAMLAGCGAQQPQQQNTPAAESSGASQQGSTGIGEGESLASMNNEDPTLYFADIKEKFTELPGDIDKGVLIGNYSDLNGASGISILGGNMTAFVYKTDKSTDDAAKELETYMTNNGYTNITNEKVGTGEYMVGGNKDGKNYSFQVYTKDGKTIMNALVASE